MRPISVKLDEETIATIDTEAEERDLTRSQYIRRILDARHETQAEEPAPADLDARVRQLEARVDRLDRAEATEATGRTEHPTTTDSARREATTTPDDDQRDQQTLPSTHERDDRETTDDIEAILHDWRPGRSLDKRERQREVGRVVIEWLRDQEVASASEFKAELEPDHPVEGQSPPTWWKQTAREALKRAQERGLVRFVDGRKEWRWNGE